ncbi:hypothetical protein D3C87_103110 [compost metagenome]
MKSLVLVLTTFFAALAASAQTPRITEATFLKKERQDLEAQTEQRIMEMLETSRLREEQARMQKLESTSFSVVQPAPAIVQQPAVQAVQVVPEADATQTW